MKSYYLAIIVLISLSIFCKGASLGMIGHGVHMLHTMDHTGNCCLEDIGGENMASHHDVVIALTDIVLLVAWALFIGAAVRVFEYSFYILQKISQRAHDPPLVCSYLQHFIYRGLLHPKTW